MDGTRASPHQIGIVQLLQCPADCVPRISNVINLAATESESPKLGNVCACSTTAADWIPKWMARGDLAHRIGVVQCSKSLTDCSERGCKVLNTGKS